MTKAYHAYHCPPHLPLRPVPTGTGDLDPEYVLKQLPSMLSLEEKKIKPIIKEIVASRRRMLLVQAVSQYRQKRPAETVVSLQNLLSCSRALPEKDAMLWSERAELRDIFQAFCSQVRDHERSGACPDYILRYKGYMMHHGQLKSSVD